MRRRLTLLILLSLSSLLAIQSNTLITNDCIRVASQRECSIFRKCCDVKCKQEYGSSSKEHFCMALLGQIVHEKTECTWDIRSMLRKRGRKRLAKYSPKNIKWSLPESTESGHAEKGSTDTETILIKQLRRGHKYSKCVECSIIDGWRIRLRLCGHIVCLKCALDWLQRCILTTKKARIGCLKQGCPRRIHPNDIDALLEPDNAQLDDYMAPEIRTELQLKHERTQVEYALSGCSTSCITSVNCPECKMPYMKEPGCNYVQCAFQSCNTWFCFECGQPVDSVGHFTKGVKCMLGVVDLYRASYLLRMMLETSVLGVVLLMPAIVYASMVLLPLAIFVTFVYKCTVYLTSSFSPRISTILKPFVALPMSIIGFILAPLSLFVGFLFVGCYILFLIFRFLPVAMTMNITLKLGPKLARLFGVSSIEDLVAETQEAKLLLEIEAYQQVQEQSEAVDEDQMTRSQALEYRIRREDHEKRYARSLGLNKFRTGESNIIDAAVRANKDVEAHQDGR